MTFRRDRVKPTQYPRLPFHGIRSTQLVSSFVVASIMFYFCSELARDNYQLPWTFILLFAVSLLTIVALTATIALHCWYGLSPVLNTALNFSLAIIWALAFALLAWWSSGTLAHVCNVDNWESDEGISICRLYKALFSFALFGLVSTLLALVLDVRVQRSVTTRGRFQQLDTLGTGGKRKGHVHVHSSSAANGDGSGLQRQHDGHEQGRDGYAWPAEQFAYDDSFAYTGSGGQLGRRSLDGRI
ncbi:hypothetical protein T440DRAFT_491882 [Plenodomus tracheiphilus IPT5]|uniref:MARVEL domain-containing protein n=1 Tax=Plenodomus tracheiphilus IPT5 TaxID=1408161 RepID=A0A6A7AXA2_9PLEO|nr:hypothetical protein T440DRAFT_491882 [Plenodomus tracheiphilus IPT5]